MESEDSHSFYDSLEESSDTFSDCESNTTPKLKAKRQKPQQSPFILETENTDNISNIVPLFGYNANKSDIKLHRKIKRGYETDKKYSASSVGPLPVREKCKQNTYLKLFYDKINYPIVDTVNGAHFKRKYVKKPTLSTRAVCATQRDANELNELTQEFYFNDLEPNDSDDENFSFFEKMVACDKNKGKALPDPSKLMSDSSIALVANLKSVSEKSFNNTVKSCLKTTSRHSTVSSRIPVRMGSMGPDVEASRKKLEILRKRQSYGQKVSEKNRIKQNEIKILKNLNKDKILNSLDNQKC